MVTEKLLQLFTFIISFRFVYLHLLVLTPNQKLQNACVMVSMFYCVRTKRDEFISKLCLCLLKEHKTNLSMYMSFWMK